MSLTCQEITTEAMKLTPGERLDLAEKLWISVDTPADIAAAWGDEAERRADAFDRGEIEGIDVDEAIAQARARIAARHSA